MPANPPYITSRAKSRHTINFGLKASRTPWDMLDIGSDREPFVQEFVGGTVYQAFLGPQDYHRWHAGAEPGDPDLAEGDPHGSLLRSQAWHATRAIIFIQADNPDIGLMCFIGVGMVEVSTCIISVDEQQKVQTGDQLGMFRFGGSTHVLLSGPQANITFADHVIPDTHILVNSILAQVSPAN
ncbi:L-tryptophan decarboxylase [Psilocybe cubensis]|uniref:Phosphatidylserine decarboxylase n=2 Tax=Psilocybe cubensis TaxID=181762 RepID=A0A8H7XPC7_PSICU|nr:L-tryptophan decarboxylase [Psilocybe cubensis]KAH9475235.1 L-tryptophan decarboxylase [Psilocybe cubensis]